MIFFLLPEIYECSYDFAYKRIRLVAFPPPPITGASSVMPLLSQTVKVLIFLRHHRFICTQMHLTSAAFPVPTVLPVHTSLGSHFKPERLSVPVTH